jgi:hypothetical protein
MLLLILLRPGDKRMAALKTAEDVRALFKELFPAFLPAVREVRTAGDDVALCGFSMTGPCGVVWRCGRVAVWRCVAFP